MTGEIVWRPDPAAAEKTALAGFMREVGCRDFDDLLARSDADPEWYWDAVIRHFAIRFDRPYDRVRDLSAGVAWPKWLVGATMNITASLIDRHVEAGFGDRPALSGETEDGRLVRIAATEDVTQSAEGEHNVHLPSPSYWPLVLAVSLPIMGYGLIFNHLLIAVGAGVLLASMFGWSLEPHTASDADYDPPPPQGGAELEVSTHG